MSDQFLQKVLDYLLAQRDAPAPDHRAELEERLKKRGVSPVIIERVLRLNPVIHEGSVLRGVHYKRQREPGLNLDCCTRGHAIRQRGRAWVESLPKGATFRRGRRQYITATAWMECAP